MYPLINSSPIKLREGILNKIITLNIATFLPPLPCTLSGAFGQRPLPKSTYSQVAKVFKKKI